MAGTPLSKNSMQISIIEFSRALQKQKIEHFVFFGTLLGLIRDGGPIKGDDDVDFYVNKNNHEDVRKILLFMGFSLDFTKYPNDTQHFLQANGYIDKKKIRVDFYFYDADSDESFLLEFWNFCGEPHDKKKLMKIPKPLIFPLSINVFSCRYFPIKTI